MVTEDELKVLQSSLQGDLYFDDVSRRIYATDASAYREIPLAVARPRNEEDLYQLILFVRKHGITLIPRSGGTSLAGQVVGDGLVVDVSKYMNRILEINPEAGYARIQPGVILDELNLQLKPYGLFFAPETSTSNRCTLGGMVGNNSCGSHALVYGSTRDHILSVKALLSDGQTVVFESLSLAAFEKKCHTNGLEGDIYRTLCDILQPQNHRDEILRQSPSPKLRRRNNGYALDELMHSEPFESGQPPFNMCKLIAGSEGTLVLVSEIKVKVVPLPPPVKLLSCVHLHSVEEAMLANLVALKFHPKAVELMDRAILNCTKQNIGQSRNRFFIEGDPGALLIVEFAGENMDEVCLQASQMEDAMQQQGYGYHFSRVSGSDVPKVWALRKAGLGVLSNMVGDAKPVAVTEDTAVDPEVLPAYIAELKEMMRENDLLVVYHGHISTGELHLRPVLNLKKRADVERFRKAALLTAHLVKKYHGSLSGEHGDGRLRGEFIPIMYGEQVYRWFLQIKNAFDAQNVFNRGKIVNTPPMDVSLRYEPECKVRDIDTIFDFSAVQGMMRAVEKCNGSGDCRKPHTMGGTMCPIYMVTRDENNATRGRANYLREVLTNATTSNLFNDAKLYQMLSTCSSCKGCKSECPSGIDMAKLKAEFLQHYYQSNGVPLRTWLFGHIDFFNRWMSESRFTTAVYNWGINQTWLTRWVGVATRKMPALLPRRKSETYWQNVPQPSNVVSLRCYLGVDEFTRSYEPEMAAQAIHLLTRLGYEVIPVAYDSGRAMISKGLLLDARKKAESTVSRFSPLISEDSPLVGIEPSCILSFKDEYPELVHEPLRDAARTLSQNTYTFESFVMREVNCGNILSSQFKVEPAVNLWVHGHCQQKAIISSKPLCDMLRLPEGVTVHEIPSGCCGMAGSYGYEKEHFAMSMQIGELVLFPAVRSASLQDVIIAPGFSCRHHIAEGTQRQAVHPITFMDECCIA